MTGHRSAADLRSGLDHPVVDADGHWVEYGPVVAEELRKREGDLAAEGFLRFRRFVEESLQLTVAERRRRGLAQQAFWGVPTRNTLDRATAMMPRLFHHRLDELGIDFAVAYPTGGLALPSLGSERIRRATCRAFNSYQADLFADLSARMTPAAVIPVHSPQEAVEELEHCAELGLKVVMMGSVIRRRGGEGAADWHDVLGLDSAFDYDPVWQRCVELGFAPTFHAGSRGLGLRLSPSNFVFNHIGHFAAAGEATCKAIYLGGVTRRFPTLQMAFLEGGVGWAVNLFADLIGHWEKRNREALEVTNPDNLDRAALAELVGRFGEPGMADAVARGEGLREGEGIPDAGGIADLDDFSAVGVTSPDDIKAGFVDRFWFGCEADDPLNAWAFNTAANPRHARFSTLFGSDVGHFDVPDMAAVLPEAYELVDDGLITTADFADFVFGNAVRFWGRSNPRFFEGTVVEGPAAALLAASADH